MLVRAAEAATLSGLPVVGIESLAEAIDHLGGGRQLPAAHALPADSGGSGDQPDLADIRGQQAARRALEVAAAGGHNLLKYCPKKAHGSGHPRRPDCRRL